MPRAFDELDHQHAKSLAHGAKSGAQSASGFALARSGVDDEQSFFFRHENYEFAREAEKRQIARDIWGTQVGAGQQIISFDVQALDEFLGVMFHAFDGCGGKRSVNGDFVIVKYDPEAGAVDFV